MPVLLGTNQGPDVQAKPAPNPPDADAGPSLTADSGRGSSGASGCSSDDDEEQTSPHVSISLDLLKTEKADIAADDLLSVKSVPDSDVLHVEGDPPILRNIQTEDSVTGDVSLKEDDLAEDIDRASCSYDPLTVSEDVVSCQLPEYLQLLLTGLKLDGDSRHLMSSRPEWLDMDKFRRGQKFALKHFFGLVYAEMISLMMLFSFHESVQPLIFTCNSDTPYKAFKRYLSTVNRVTSWYRGNIWDTDDKAHKHIKIVRAMHDGIRHRLNSTPYEILKDKVTLQGSAPVAIWSPLYDNLQQDFQDSCPAASVGQCPYLSTSGKQWVNQSDMAITQFGFVGLMILHPDKLGAYGASDDDLDAFLHLWRGIGYMLGIDDKYNFCTGSLETVRQRSRDLIEFWVKPNLRHVSPDWEHMSRCMIEGISYYVPCNKFEPSLLYLCSLIGVPAPRLKQAMTWWHSFLYYLVSFVLCFLLRLPGSLAYHNWMLHSAIRRARMASGEWLAAHQSKVYTYQTRTGAVCTKL